MHFLPRMKIRCTRINQTSRRGAEGKVGFGLIEIHVNDFWSMMRFDALLAD
jgi:hypothetical protein